MKRSRKRALSLLLALALVLSLGAPALGAEARAESEKPYMIRVDFGAEHADYAKRNFDGKAFPVLGEDTVFRVEGSVVSFQCIPEDGIYDSVMNAISTFESVCWDLAGIDDNGERFMQTAALHPLAYYLENYADFPSADPAHSDTWDPYDSSTWPAAQNPEDAYRWERMGDNREMQASYENGVTLYALWAQPVSDVIITVTPPVCGTTVQYEYKTGIYVWAQPSPQLAVSGPAHFEDYQLFYNDWDLSDYGIYGILDGPLTMTGGNSYKAMGFLGAEWGYFIPEDLLSRVTAVNGTVEDPGEHALRNFFVISVPVPHIDADGDNRCDGCGMEVHKLTVYGDGEGNTVLRSELVAAGTALKAFGENVSKTDFTFTGWTTEARTGGEFDYNETLPEGDPNRNDPEGRYPCVLFDLEEEVMPGRDLGLYPVLVRDRLRVLLDPQGTEEAPVTMPKGSDGKEQSLEFTVNLNEKLRMEAMNAAARPGYELTGWFTSGGVMWNESWGVSPEYCDRDDSGQPIRKTEAEKNYSYYTVSLSARWTPKVIPVRYDVGDRGAGSVSDGEITLGGILKLPAGPEAKAGFRFVCWQDKNGGKHTAGEDFAFGDWSLTEDGELRFAAVYEADGSQNGIYTVSFDTDGGRYIPSFTAAEGTAIPRPEDPERPGYAFAGWVPEIPEAMPDHDLTVAARWTANSYTLRFETMGGSETPAITAAFGAALTKPADPTKEHYAFEGWDPAFPAAMPAEDLTLTARWTPAEYTIVFDAMGGVFADGKSTAAFTDIYGAELTVPRPARAGYRFEGWTLEGKDAEIPAYMPDSGATYTAKWAQEAEEGPEPEPEPETEPWLPELPVMVPKVPAAPELPFTDVAKDDPYYDDIKYVYEKGIMIGLSDTLFGPGLPLSRDMTVTVLYRLEGEPGVAYSGVFTDVPDGKWYTSGVEWAAAAGVVLGYGDGRYGVGDDVTREQLAAILWRYALWRGWRAETAELGSADAGKVSDWAAEAMGWAVAAGILTVGEDGTARPGEAATRGEIARAIRVFLETVAE